MRDDIQQRYEAAVSEFQRFLERLDAEERKSANKGFLARLTARFTARYEKQRRRRIDEIRKDQ